MSHALKEKLYDLCKAIADEKVKSIQAAISSAQQAANSETKSTAGDKHDTSRAMMQLEVEQKSKQLLEAEKLKQALVNFNPDSGTNQIALGSLVFTNTANYYISISVGKLDIEEQLYFAISPVSPIAKVMIGKKAGESFQFNGKEIKINAVH